MRLDVGHATRRHVRSRQRLAHHRGLCQAVGDPEGAAAAGLVDGPAAHQRPDAVAVGACVGEALDEHHAAAFCAHETVGRGVECLAVAVRRKHAPAGQRQQQFGRQDHVDAARDRQPRFAVAQAAAGAVDRHQRRRAGRVDRHRRALQAERVRHAPRRRVDGVAGDDVGIVLRARQALVEQLQVVGGRGSDEHAAARTLQAERRDVRALERLPGDLEEQALLRVHQLRFARADAEKFCVETVDPRQHAGLVRHACASRSTDTLERCLVPALRRDVDDRVAAAAQQIPESVDVGCTGKAAGGADDRQRFVACRFQCVDALAHLAQRGQCLALHVAGAGCRGGRHGRSSPAASSVSPRSFSSAISARRTSSSDRPVIVPCAALAGAARSGGSASRPSRCSASGATLG